MNFTIQYCKRGQRVLWTDGAQSYLAAGMRWQGVNAQGDPCTPAHRLGGILEWMLATWRCPRQLLRLGIHHLWPLADGAFLVVMRKRAYRVESSGAASMVLRFPRGNKPAHKGVCALPTGEVYVAEYAMNFDRTLPVTLYRSQDFGRTFDPIFEFTPGEVRHIHFIQHDPYTDQLWMGTGDADNESWVYSSADRGQTWTKVGGGSQYWRAVGVAFRPEALYWGTDAGSDAGKHPNYVMRLDRGTGQLTQVLELQGPCHGSATLRDGTLCISTGVEGGVNEKDRYAHLWISRHGETWQELTAWKKDSWPLLMQYGVIRFPQGLSQSETLLFTCYGLAGAGETAYCVQLTGDSD